MPYPRRTVLAALALAAAIGFGSYVISGIPSPAALLGWYGNGACDDSVAQNPGSPNGCRSEARELACNDGVDNDSDEVTDSLDSDCGACVAMVEECGNGKDDDCDGAIDCADADCAYSIWSLSTWRCAGYEMDCGNGADDDADGYADCQDSDCTWTPSCYEPPRKEDCWNAMDDDGDGDADCQDSDCAGPQCGTPCPPGTVPGFTPSGTYNCVPTTEDCWNSSDDDSDGAVDCQDADCANVPECLGRSEVCGNGADDDADGLIDCQDGDCANEPFCGGGCTGSYCECNPTAPECGGSTCADACESPTCAGYDLCTCQPDHPSCVDPENCGNGADDDRDGEADCQDSDCSGNCECTGSCGTSCDDPGACNYGSSDACTYCECDGLDNNDDGMVDEPGEECPGTPPTQTSCIVISVSGINANGDFDAAVQSEIAKSDGRTSFVSLGGTQDADATASSLEATLKGYYQNSNPDERILVVAHSLGAIATHNMRQTFGGSYSDTTFMLYDAPYNYPGSANPMRWFSGTLRAIARARQSGVAGALTADWTGGYDDPGDATEDANHVKFTSGSSVLTGIKGWVDGCPEED